MDEVLAKGETHDDGDPETRDRDAVGVTIRWTEWFWPDVGSSDVSELREGVDESECNGAFCGWTRECVGYPAVEDDEAGVALGL